jgi:hypothetical protein
LFESMKWTCEIGEKHKEFFKNKIYEENFVIILNYSSNYFRYFEAFFSWPVLLFSTCDYLPSETFCGMCQISGLFESSDMEIISIPKKNCSCCASPLGLPIFLKEIKFQMGPSSKKK